MNDEEYSFVSDVRDKKVTGRSARNKRTRPGKGGRVRLPSDNLSKKELEKMSGEVKSYRLNDPMTWAEFKAMPDDLKVTYIKLIRNKYKVPDLKIAEVLFGVGKDALGREVGRLGINTGNQGWNRNWDKEGFYAWANGTTVNNVAPEDTTQEEISEPFMEEDVAAWEEPNPKTEEPDPIAPSPTHCIPVQSYEVKRAIPHSGHMDFEGEIGEVLESIAVLLGGAYAKVCISWEVYSGGKENEDS